jgi:hypothetical protein
VDNAFTPSAVLKVSQWHLDVDLSSLGLGVFIFPKALLFQGWLSGQPSPFRRRGS